MSKKYSGYKLFENHKILYNNKLTVFFKKNFIQL